GVGSDAAGDHRRADAFGGERAHQQADIEGDIAHDEVRAIALAKHGEPLLDAVRMRDFRAFLHGDLDCRAELAPKGAENEKPHDPNPLSASHALTDSAWGIPLDLSCFDDFRHGHAQAVFHQHHFAARDQPVIDVDVDGFADLAVELHHCPA